MREQQTGVLQLCQNGERFEFIKMQSHIFLEHINQSVEELKQYHTYDLYLLLKEVREARSQTYYGLQLLNKASKTEKNYRLLQMKRVEIMSITQEKHG